jgi:hypothetical protein
VAGSEGMGERGRAPELSLRELRKFNCPEEACPWGIFFRTLMAKLW